VKTISTTAVLTVAASVLFFPGHIAAQEQAPAQPPAQSATGPKTTGETTRAEAYYYFTMGRLRERQYEITAAAERADESVEFYKKALELEPDSPVILERLAEIYAESQHIRDAVLHAQKALKIDPNNVEAHRLLARIYVRTLGDINAGQVQQDNLAKAVEQFEAVLRIEPRDTQAALWLARLYRFENQPAEAEKVLRGILAHETDNGSALEQLSQLLVDENRSQEAIGLLTQAASDSASPDLYDLLGDAYSEAKNYAKAEAAYGKAIEADPDDPGHRHGLAQALVAQEKYADALAQFQKLSQLEPGTAENYLRISQLARRLGRFHQAQSSLLRAKQLAPGNLEVLYNEALLYEDQGRYADAVKVLTNAIAGIKSQAGGTRDSNALAILYEQLGRAFREQHDYSAAIDTYEEMAKLGPESEKRARMLLIDTYRRSRDIDRAIAEAKKGLEESPKDPALTVALAMLYGERTETATATQLLRGLLRGNDDDQQIYIDIAQVQERGRKYAEAEQSAQKAEQMARDNSAKEAAWFMLGAIYERQKKFDKAEQQFRRVLDLNPNNAPVLNYYGYMLADRGVRIDEAASLIQRAVKQDPQNGAYLDSLGWAYYKQNKLAEAEEYLRRAIDREGQDPTILGHLGDVYLKLGQSEHAAELYERALAEWQKAVPADYQADKVSELDAQLKNLKRRLAQKSAPETAKPQ
jgi:tetratricopeptide (TPR) repeat protein